MCLTIVLEDWVECRLRAFSSAFQTSVRSAFGAFAFAFAHGVTKIFKLPGSIPQRDAAEMPEMCRSRLLQGTRKEP